MEVSRCFSSHVLVLYCLVIRAVSLVPALILYYFSVAVSFCNKRTFSVQHIPIVRVFGQYFRDTCWCLIVMLQVKYLNCGLHFTVIAEIYLIEIYFNSRKINVL